jgi:hypothetical protein
MHCGLDGLTKDPTSPLWWMSTINGKTAYVSDSTYQRCKHDPTLVGANGEPEVSTLAFTTPYVPENQDVPDQIYLCPQWLAWLKYMGGYHQESWIFETTHKLQTTTRIPKYSSHWPQSALTAQVKTLREDETSTTKPKKPWISTDYSSRAYWTIAHEVCITKFLILWYRLITFFCYSLLTRRSSKTLPIIPQEQTIPLRTTVITKTASWSITSRTTQVSYQTPI